MKHVIKLSGNFSTSAERAELISQIEAAQYEMSQCRYGSEEYYAAKKQVDAAKRAHEATFAKKRTAKTYNSYRVIYETKLKGVCSDITCCSIVNGVEYEDAPSALSRVLNERGDTLIRIIQIDVIDK